MADEGLLTIFDRINRAAANGQVDLHSESKKAINWLSKEVQKYKRITDVDIHGNKKLSPFPQWGSLYAFHYFPKHHMTLPYYDIFPLVFRIGNRDSGFLGMNWHYLSPSRRFKLMKALMQDTNMNTEKKRMVFDYQVLKAAGNMPYYKPSIKHYLRSQYRSSFMKIERADWFTALYLPTARFQKMEAQTVWRKSNEKIRGYNGV